MKKRKNEKPENKKGNLAGVPRISTSDENEMDLKRTLEKQKCHSPKKTQRTPAKAEQKIFMENYWVGMTTDSENFVEKKH